MSDSITDTNSANVTVQDISTDTSSSSTSSNVSYSSKFTKLLRDRRVSLNVSTIPTTSDFASRVAYVLGNEKHSEKNIYGLLYKCLNKSCGLIFPYTPQIQMNNKAKYETTDIFHSNLTAIHYENSPAPTIHLNNCVFTADTRENALHMLSAIWFLRAVTKCDFGELANGSSDDDGTAGLPPPVLYLNGYNQLMDNIPVVVTDVGYTFPHDKNYVCLGIDLGDSSGKFKYTGATQLDGDLSILNKLTQSDNKKSYFFNNWLPTELTFNITLQVAPNLLKTKKEFSLNDYKMGFMNLKRDFVDLKTADSNGKIENIDARDLEKAIAQGSDNVKNLQTNLELNGEILGSMLKKGSNASTDAKREQGSNILDTLSKLERGQKILSSMQSELTNVNNQNQAIDAYNNLQNNLNKNPYQFDNSGWTW